MKYLRDQAVDWGPIYYHEKTHTYATVQPIDAEDVPLDIKRWGESYLEVEPFIFQATIRIWDLKRSGHQARYSVRIEDTTPCFATISLSDLLTVLHTKDVEHGEVTGTWEWSKQGRTFGIRLAAYQECGEER